jgi:HAD superfamily hydrolase (TIGR01549 family)
VATDAVKGFPPQHLRGSQFTADIMTNSREAGAMAEMIKAIFFDAGNTLVFPRVEELIQEITAQGYPATFEDFRAADRLGRAKLDEILWPLLRQGKLPRTADHVYWNEYLRALMEQLHVPAAKRKAVTDQLAARFREVSFWSHVFPETPAFLDSLRARGYYLGVISNSVGWIEQQLGAVGLAPRFNTILDSAVVGIEKPHGGIFRMALERAKVRAAEAIFVGDTYATDVGGAQMAGLHGVLFDLIGAYPEADCPRVSSLPELDQVLERL